jgi:hypothetical protein
MSAIRIAEIRHIAENRGPDPPIGGRKYDAIP